MNAPSVCFEFPFGGRKIPSDKNKFGRIYNKQKILENIHLTPAVVLNKELVKLRWTQRGEKQNKGTIGQTSWAEMACTVSAASRAAPHIRACLHSTGLLQSLTAGKTSLLLWAGSQEKATSASLSQRTADSDSLSPTATESNNRLVSEKTERKMTGDKLWGRSYFLWSKWKALGRESLSSQTKIKCLTCKAPLVKKAKFLECWMKLKQQCMLRV